MPFVLPSSLACGPLDEPDRPIGRRVEILVQWHRLALRISIASIHGERKGRHPPVNSAKAAQPTVLVCFHSSQAFLN
ncbi:MAG TPA: hypothetical protein VJR23_07905 [Candidatus Acidoferrales bacterium]|nr:hypothetical protein [Candidatus Acidoferrales bacterium]